MLPPPAVAGVRTHGKMPIQLKINCGWFAVVACTACRALPDWSYQVSRKQVVALQNAVAAAVSKSPPAVKFMSCVPPVVLLSFTRAGVVALDPAERIRLGRLRPGYHVERRRAL